MTGRAGPSYPLERLLRSSAQQLETRAAGFAAAAGFLALVWFAGGHHPLLTVVGVLLAAQAAVLPATHAPLALVLYLGGLWLVATPGRLDLWTLAASVLLAAVHLACALASHGPEGLVLDRRLVRAWAGRTVACVAAACAAWLAGLGVAALHPAPGAAVPALALVLVLAWSALVATRLLRRG